MDEPQKVQKIAYGSEDHPIHIGDLEIQCYVLEDGTRVLTQASVNKALARPEGGSKDVDTDGSRNLPRFLELKPLRPFISAGLLARASSPIPYIGKGGRTNGIPAIMLPEICDVWLQARDANVLKGKALETARMAEIIMRGLAHVGIIALVDEATGYQEVREKEELQLILSKYIAKELLPWTMRFPHEFYQEMFRLKGWEYNAQSRRKRPKFAGYLTKKLIYDQLPEGVIDEIKKQNVKRTEGTATSKGTYEKHHHRYLTKEIGIPHLDKLVASVTTLMRISPNWRKFEENFARAFGVQRMLDLPETGETGEVA